MKSPRLTNAESTTEDRGSKKRRQAERDERASNTEQRATYNVGKREQMHRHRSSAHRGQRSRARRKTQLETQDKVAKTPKMDVTENRWLFRLMNLRSCLKAIVPKNTVLGFKFHMPHQVHRPLEVRKENNEEPDGDVPGYVRRVDDSVLSTVEK